MLSCRPAVIDFISPVVLKCVFKNALNIHKAIRYGFLLHSLLHHPSYGPRVSIFHCRKKTVKVLLFNGSKDPFNWKESDSLLVHHQVSSKQPRTMAVPHTHRYVLYEITI